MEKIAISVDLNSQGHLRKAAMTSMESKLVAEHREYLADLAVKAVLQVTEKEPSKYKADIDDKVEKKSGKSVRDTKLIDGIVLDKGVVHSGMPKRVENAKIALLDTALEIQKTEFDARINIESPEQIDAFLKRARFGCLRIYQHHSVFFMHVRACAWTLPAMVFLSSLIQMILALSPPHFGQRCWSLTLNSIFLPCP